MSKEKEIENEKKTLASEARKKQAEASDPAYSVWVEASAGTGKTKVLSDRVFRLLLEKVPPSKILCLTYTKAAAVEMNSRIYETLSKWAVASDEDLETEIKELYNDENILQKKPDLIVDARRLFASVLDAMQPIKIQTLHGFCEDILKRFPLEAGVSPYFEVMDERLTDEILEQISQNLMKEFEDTDDEKLKSAVSFLTKNVSELNWSVFLKKLVGNRHKLLKIFSQINLPSFLEKVRKNFALDDEPSKEKLIAQFESRLDRNEIKKCALAMLEGCQTDKDHAAYLMQALENFDYDVYKKAFYGTGGPFKELAHKDAIEIYEPILAVLGLELVRIQDLEDKFSGLRVYEATKAVAEIAMRLIEEYNVYKSSHARMDYDDLIMTTKELLEKDGVSAWVLYKLDGGIEHVLIDEAQDTSPNQWAIVQALTGDFFSGKGQSKAHRTIFAVGDRKQSIFKFQGAEPECFEKMEDEYRKKIAKNFKSVKLEVSFRSVKAVLDTVNYLFSLPDAIPGVADGGSEVKHNAFRLGEGGKVELLPLTLSDEDEAKQEDVWTLPVVQNSETSPISKLAAQIAAQIKSMVENGEVLASKGRPLEYKDFMVLVRRRKPFMKEFVRACKNIGVEICGVDRLKLLDEIVIEDLLSLADFLLLPSDDLSLACVLKSPLYGLIDDDLFELCHKRGDLSLWQRLSANPKYKAQKEEILELLKSADSLRPFEIFNMVLNTFEGKRRFFARFGAECKDPLDEFMNLVLAFEREHVPYLQNFMTWIYGGDIEIKREMEQETTDAVRIMTVHSSKGLQAPIVILPDTTSLVPTSRSSGFIFDDNLFYYPLAAGDYNDFCNKAHKNDVQKELDEYRRLLYVALTRAEDRLYIAGFKKSVSKKSKKEDESEKKPKNWYELCSDALNVLGIKTKDETLVVPSLQEIEPKEKKENKMRSIVPEDNDWARTKVLKESPLSKPYSPSHMEDDDETPVASPLEDDGTAYRRGTLIHRLLQLLGCGLSVGEQADFVKKYLQKEKDLSLKAKESIEKEVLDLLSSKEFAFIFDGDSRAEVPIMGEVDGKIISGQIDRLIVKDDKVYVIDFKTNRPAVLDREKVYPQYVTQLDIYKKLLGRIYPSKQIETYILWTNVLKLMKI